jgi:hypothetical protein
MCAPVHILDNLLLGMPSHGGLRGLTCRLPPLFLEAPLIVRIQLARLATP